MDSDPPLLAHALVHCCQSGTVDHACVVAVEEDGSMVDPGDVTDSSEVPGSDHIDQKAK